MKAFDALERMDPNSVENFDGKKASVLNLLNAYVGGADLKDAEFVLKDALQILRDARHPQMRLLGQIIRQYAKDNGIPLF